MQVFIWVWFGQLVSIVGSGLTSFALGVWVYQNTESVTQFALIAFFSQLPGIIIAPIAGGICDRCNRRAVMILSDTIAGLSTLAIVLLIWSGNLEIWHIYLVTAVSSIARSFQQLAYAAATTLLVAKQHLGRASGAIELSKAAGHLLSPVLAGILIDIIQIQGIIWIDFITFLFAFAILLVVRFPQPKSQDKNQVKPKFLLQDIFYGWNYIATRPGLTSLVVFFVITNFAIGTAQVLVTPMILSFATAEVLGKVLSLGASGMLLGSIVMSVSGGFQRRIFSILIFESLLGISILVMGLRPNPAIITIAAFILFFCLPFIIGSDNVIWQTKVPPEVQGRVFAIRGAIAWLSFPLAYLAAGPLADYVFEPLLTTGGVITDTIGSIIGVGAGRGIGLLFVVMGIMVILTTLGASRYPRLRRLEKELPDVIY